MSLMKLQRGPRNLLCLLLLALLVPSHLRAAEPIRRVQEELRRRNLFFGDIDGRASPELAAALRLYQTHKGFEPTGKMDAVTARSLQIDLGPVTSEVVSTRVKWPDVPVLKSDAARDLSAEQQAELEKNALANLDASPAPQLPSATPQASPALDPEQATMLVEDFLRTNEGNNLSAQLKYYAYPVDYFDHGEVSEKFVARDNANYMRRWPQRHYQLLGPVTVKPGPNEDETLVEFPISFQVRNRQRRASGGTRNFWTLRPEGKEWKIIAIREEHLRE